MKLILLLTKPLIAYNEDLPLKGEGKYLPFTANFLLKHKVPNNKDGIVDFESFQI